MNFSLIRVYDESKCYIGTLQRIPSDYGRIGNRGTYHIKVKGEKLLVVGCELYLNELSPVQRPLVRAALKERKKF